MFFAHLPAGYLIGRAILRRAPEMRGTWIVTAAMVGGIFPDLDLLYLYLVDATPQHHHTYWTHLPAAWLGISLLTMIAARHRSNAFRLGLLSFMLGWISHLLLDTLVGHIWWLYPLSGQSFALAEVENRYQPWWMNFILHWTMLCELVIIAVAAWVEVKSPLIFSRFRLPKFLVAFGLMLCALVLMETYRPTPILAQPVLGASAKDWNTESYWHPNWGNSGTHKGIDIFAERGTPVLAAKTGLVVYQGKLKQGGNVVVVLSPRGWLHYYAHLNHALAPTGSWAERRETIGYVGSTGNAVGKPPHLHYAIFSPIPRLQSFRPVAQGWKRVFYRDPGKLINQQRASAPFLRLATG